VYKLIRFVFVSIFLFYFDKCMNSRKSLLTVLFLLFIFSFLSACEENKQEKNNDNGRDAYIKEVKQYRAEKDSTFKYDSRSPISEEERKNFEDLKYFEPDTKYYVVAQFIKHENPDTLKITTTKHDDIRTMQRYGEFRFRIDGKEYTLQGYVNVPIKKAFYVFLPFTDLTTGEQTYEGGRYLDIEFTPGDTSCVLDFNLAYNPYCVYNSCYSCPLVPLENNLNVEILAGEKTLKPH